MEMREQALLKLQQELRAQTPVSLMSRTRMVAAKLLQSKVLVP